MAMPLPPSGPRSLNPAGSPEWCWQTVDLLKRYLFNIEQTWRQADEVVGELKGVHAEKILPSPDRPYGSFDKLCKELLGMRAQEVAKRIDREKIKALGPHGGDRRSNQLQVGGAANLKVGANTADYVTARLKREDPELAGRVISGEISADAAARQKGWRREPRPRIRVRLDSAESAALTLRKHMPRETRMRLAELLTQGD